jgi:preprotein translocase subunit SecE
MANASKNKNKKPNWFKRTGAKIKETFSELKRVTWPKFGTVVKTTGVVLVIVLAFLIVVSAVDLGLAELLKLLTNTGAGV